MAVTFCAAAATPAHKIHPEFFLLFSTTIGNHGPILFQDFPDSLFVTKTAKT